MSEKRIDPRRPIPSDGYDRLRQNLESGFAEGFPVGEFPAPDNRANINRGTITRLYNDTATRVELDVIETLCKYLNVEIGELLEIQD